MSTRYSSRSRKNIVWIWLIALLVLAVVGYSAVRYYLDWSNYNRGHRAYQQANCKKAIAHFDGILTGRRLVNIGGYPARALQEKAECLPYQAAVDQQQAGNFSAALVAYTDYVNNFSGSVLANAARSQSISLFEQEQPSDLAGQESCQRIDMLLEKDMLPQREVNLPLFYFACGQFFEAAGDPESSFAMYETLLTEYPDAARAADAEGYILASSLVCEKSDSFKVNSAIANRQDFMPRLYHTCGQAYATANDQTNSFAMYEMLLAEYPEHALAAEAEASILATPVACEKSDSLKASSTIVNRKDFIPRLYLACGQAYDKAKNPQAAFDMYKALLIEYPIHPLSIEADASILANSVACEKPDLLKNTVVAKRANFMPRLYQACGRAYDKANNPQRSFAMYKALLAEYPAHKIAAEEEASLLSNPVACEETEALKKTDIVKRKNFMPRLYQTCGQYYDGAKDQQDSFAMYKALLAEYPEHEFATEAEASILANPGACEETEALKKTDIAKRENFMPRLYQSCGQAYDKAKNQQDSFDMYKALLAEYPDHEFATEAEASILANPAACKETEALKKTDIAKRADFMPSLYYNCGQAYEKDGDWENAVAMYEVFLAEYPDHALASDVETALARSIVAQAKASGAGEIPQPDRSGSAGSGVTVVVIQNDSPERLRIIFSGPESRIEELEACSSCQTYSFIGPMFCPELGPIGRYTLKPGQYDVVVESISDTGVTPWVGSWNLVSGDKYFSCFFIVTRTTFSPR